MTAQPTSAPTHRVGLVDIPTGTNWEAVLAAVDHVEVSGTFLAPPKSAAQTKWMAVPQSVVLQAPWVLTHRTAPKNSRWTADDGSGEFRDSPAARAAAADIGKLAQASSAFAVVFVSPALWAPSAHNRELLRRFFAEVAPESLFGNVRRVWVPGGLWDPMSAVSLGEQCEVGTAVDPLALDHQRVSETFSALPTAHAVFRPTGAVRALSRDRLEEIALHAGAYAQCTITFATGERLRDASSYARQFGGHASPGDDDE